MKKFLLGTVALAALGVPATAADMGVRPVARPVIAYANWTGCHIGGFVGIEAGQNNGYATTAATTFGRAGATPIPPGTVSPGVPVSNGFNMNGFLGGGDAGCDYQWGNWVFGVEGDWSQMNKSGQSYTPFGGIAGAPIPIGVTPAGAPINLAAPWIFQSTENWLATVRGRLGYAVDKWLFFVSGGGAWARIESSTWNILSPFLTPNLQNDTRSGWTVGGGFDYAITNASLMPGWSFRMEYLYVNIPSYTTFTPGFGPGLTPTGVTLTNLSTGKLTNNIVRVGLNYKFGNYAAPAVYK
jgi:outer membrane immunogenic protein